MDKHIKAIWQKHWWFILAWIVIIPLTILWRKYIYLGMFEFLFVVTYIYLRYREEKNVNNQ
jgi:hypothetical protein